MRIEPHTAFFQGFQDGWLQPQKIGTRLVWETDLLREAEAAAINNEWYGYGAKIGQFCGRRSKWQWITFAVFVLLIELFYPVS